MTLAIETRGAYQCPIVVCDYCLKPIRDARDGNYEWLPTDPEPQRLYFTHKLCSDLFRRARDAKALWCWSELRFLLVYLGTNLAWDEDEARNLIGRLSEAFG